MYTKIPPVCRHEGISPQAKAIHRTGLQDLPRRDLYFKIRKHDLLNYKPNDDVSGLPDDVSGCPQ